MKRLIYLLVFASGFATISWEVIWQLKASLALGISAFGTAVTLAVIMGGMCIGSLLVSKTLCGRATWIYGSLEIMIGLSGLLINFTFNCLEMLDTWIYQLLPSTYLIFPFSMIIALSIPAICMGATLPAFGAIADEYTLSLKNLYGLNTLGAACGVLVVALVVIPSLGVTQTIYFSASINFFVGLCAYFLSSKSIVQAKK